MPCFKIPKAASGWEQHIQGLYYWQNWPVLTKLSDPVIGSRIVHAGGRRQERAALGGNATGIALLWSDLQRIKGDFPGYEITCLLLDRARHPVDRDYGDWSHRYKTDLSLSLRKPDGLASDFILALAEDQEGSLWIGTRDGMSPAHRRQIPTYSTQDGIPSDNAVHSVSTSPRGGLWVSTSIGALYFDHGLTRIMFDKFRAGNSFRQTDA